MKFNKVAKVVALLAVTIPLTVLSARADFNDDFESYSQNLQARIYGGRASGRLNPSEYNRLQALWSNIEGIKRQYRGRTPNPQERSTIMNSLMTLDRQLTNSLHDNQFSRFQYWDTSRNDWKPDFQSRIRNLFPISTGVNYTDEIDAYQRNLQGRIEQGRSSGRLTPRELNRLNDRMRQIDLAQRDFRANGYNVWERNNLMSMLTDLDREIVAQLRDNDQSRYQYWNANNNTWSQQWWLGGGGGTVVPVAGAGNYDDEIDAYEWNLRDRMQRGAASGRLTPSELNRLQGQLDDFDRQQWRTRRGGWVSQSERNKLLNLLVAIDRNLTGQLRDNDQSRFQYWNASNNTWSRNWWSNMVTGNVSANTYDAEIDAYRRNIQNRLNTGRSSGRLTPAEYNRLNASYQQFDNLFNRYNRNSINSWERSALMNMLSNIDREIVAQLRDNDQSHYGQWNPNKQSWSNQWWRTGNNRNDNDRAGNNNRNDNRSGNNWNNRNDNDRPGSNWNNRNQQAAQQEAARLAAEKAAREASEKAAREAAEKAAADKAARDAAEKAARDAADRDRSANNRGSDGRWGNRDNDRGNRGNRGRDRNNENNNNNNDNNSNNSINNSSDNNQAGDNSRGWGRGRGRGNDNN